jgi:hypothetical protein
VGERRTGSPGPQVCVFKKRAIIARAGSAFEARRGSRAGYARAANARSRISSTPPTPEIFRYFGARASPALLKPV